MCDHVFRTGTDIRWPDDVVTVLLFGGGGRLLVLLVEGGL